MVPLSMSEDPIHRGGSAVNSVPPRTYLSLWGAQGPDQYTYHTVGGCCHSAGGNGETLDALAWGQAFTMDIKALEPPCESTVHRCWTAQPAPPPSPWCQCGVYGVHGVWCVRCLRVAALSSSWTLLAKTDGTIPLYAVNYVEYVTCSDARCYEWRHHVR